MALAKDRNTQDSNNIFLPACSYYDGAFGGSEANGVKSGSSSAIGFYGMDVYQKMAMEGGSVKVGGAGASSNSSGDSQSVLEFHGGGDDWTYSSGSLLCFEQAEKNRTRFVEHEDHELSDWADCVDINSAKWNHHLGYNKDGVDPRLSEKVNSFDASNGNGGVEGRCSINKRPHQGGGEVQASKIKQCTGASTNRKAKAKLTPAKDPQSVAAKNRRERISERLKILQDLVPNGTKVDLVTMLEKAISYVKFLQLQVKVLATDEFWPAAGGKAPEVAQVKEAIDAILSSYKERSSSSK